MTERQPSIRNQELVGLPESATTKEVWEIGLRFFKWALVRQMKPELRLKFLDRAVKWISTTPVEVSEDDRGELEVLLREVSAS